MHDLQNSQSAFLTTFTLVMTLTFNLLTSKYNQFIFVPNVHLGRKFGEIPVFLRYHVHKLLAYDHWQTDTQTAWKQNAFGG